MKEERIKYEGGKVPFERMNEIMAHVFRKARAQKGPADKNEDGEFNDFLEQRRPFTAPNPSGATH